MATTASAIIDRSNRDVELIGTITTAAGLDWINRCSRDLGKLARRSTEATLSIYTTARHYALPADYIGTIEILTSDCGTTGLADSTYDEAWKIRNTSDGNVMVFDGLPSASATLTHRYWRTVSVLGSATAALDFDDDLNDVYVAFLNWQYLEQQDEGILADRWHLRYLQQKDNMAEELTDRKLITTDERRVKGWW